MVFLRLSGFTNNHRGILLCNVEKLFLWYLFQNNVFLIKFNCAAWILKLSYALFTFTDVDVQTTIEKCQLGCVFLTWTIFDK